MRKTLTDRGVKALRPRKTRYAFPDPELAGHYVRVTPQGGRSYAAVARSHGRQIWTTIGTADTMTIKAAREQARVILQRVRAGLPAVGAKGETFAEVADNWTKRHVDAQGLRSAREIKRLLKAMCCRAGATANSSRSGSPTSPRCSTPSKTRIPRARPIWS